MKRQKGTVVMVIAGLCVLVLLGGCATHQARGTEKSQFLKDYSQLTKSDKAQLRYVDPLVPAHVHVADGRAGVVIVGVAVVALLARVELTVAAGEFNHRRMTV